MSSDRKSSTPIVVTYEEGVRFAIQIRSHRLFVDQASRAGGSDSAPSPIELLGASLGSCVAYYVQQFCQARAIPFEKLRVEVDHERDAHPDRITRFIVRVVLPADMPDHHMALLERVARSCPAHNTLAAGVAIDVNIAVPAMA